jgi:hypothetical protein
VVSVAVGLPGTCVGANVGANVGFFITGRKCGRKTEELLGRKTGSYCGHISGERSWTSGGHREPLGWNPPWAQLLLERH